MAAYQSKYIRLLLGMQVEIRGESEQAGAFLEVAHEPRVPQTRAPAGKNLPGAVDPLDGKAICPHGAGNRCCLLYTSDAADE